MEDNNADLVVGVDDEEDFASKIYSLLTDKTLANELFQNAVTAAKTKYSWDILVGDLVTGVYFYHI